MCQLLLPLMLVATVYEKANGLRIMMKMHGLGEAAYFSVQYLWFLSLYCAYMVSNHHIAQTLLKHDSAVTASNPQSFAVM